VVLPAAGIVWSVRQAGGPSWLLLVLSALGIMFGGLFLFVLSQRKTPIGDLRVSTGDSLLPFSATDSDGTPFHSDSLAGKRILLKFFRGGW
jgi:cytochrome oxidase Cu insertion factor (SCO1/SenC/PrrC family)